MWLAPWYPTNRPTRWAMPTLPLALTSELSQSREAWRSLHLRCPWFWLSSKEKKCRNLLSASLMRSFSAVLSPVGLDQFSASFVTPLTNLPCWEITDLKSKGNQISWLLCIEKAFLQSPLPTTRNFCPLDFCLPLKAALVNSEAGPHKAGLKPKKSLFTLSGSFWLPPLMLISVSCPRSTLIPSLLGFCQPLICMIADTKPLSLSHRWFLLHFCYSELTVQQDFQTQC